MKLANQQLICFSSYSDGAKLERFVFGNNLSIRHKQPNPDTPMNFQNPAVIRSRRYRQHGAKSLRVIKRFFGEGQFFSAFKKVYSNIFFAFSFGNPKYGCFDRIGHDFIV